jgi:hypothetical protein
MVEVELAVATPAQSPGICGAWNFSRRLCAALLIVLAMLLLSIHAANDSIPAKRNRLLHRGQPRPIASLGIARSAASDSA